jgi:bifunctional DNase/RNase
MKREVKIIGLSYSQSQPNAYVVVMSEVNGHRKLPIVIKSQDAQTVALRIEKLKLPRPLTHDIIKILADGYRIDCQEVCIYQVLEGVFYSKLVTNNGIDDLEIDTTVGDAIALALTFDCPLYVTEEVLSTCGIQTDDSGNVVEGDTKSKKKRKKKDSVVSIEDLKRMMEEAIGNEEYELAAELRDKITKLEEEGK